MGQDKRNTFQLTFAENLKKDTNLTTTERLSFDDLGDFIEEREKIKRTLESFGETKLRVDFSDFANHVFFDNAVKKHNIAKDRILDQFPFNGTLEEKDAFNLTGSDYEEFILEQWPRFVGFAHISSSLEQFISASDTDNVLLLGSSSLYVSTWIQPVISDENLILQLLSSSTGPVLKQGYELYLSGASDPHIKFTIHSGSEELSVSSSYSSFASTFNNVAVIYDNPADLVSLYINETRVASSSITFGPIEFAPSEFLIASGTRVDSVSSSFDFYSGSIDEIRVLHTASELFHVKNFSRPIDAESYVKLHYKLNEGIVGTASVDCNVIDFSQNALHGKILNFASNLRVSGSVMGFDPGDPILYSFHADVISFTGSAILSASLYDDTNNNNIFNMIPERLLIDDENTDGLYTSFVLSLSRFFDELKLFIDQFDNLRITNYSSFNETPDLMLPLLQRYFGWKVTEHFGDANPLNFFFGENILASGSLDVPLFEIRNQFWRRTLNNLPYLLKTKGKRHNLDAFFNVLGINQENINLKEYGYLPGGSIQDDRIEKEKATPLLGIGTGSFSSSFVRVDALVSADNSFDMFPWTVETMLQLPFVSASYTANELTGSVWEFVSGSDDAVRLFWIRPDLTSETGKFVLSSSAGDIFSSSNVDVFDGEILHVSAGRFSSSFFPFIKLRGIEGCDINVSQDFEGTGIFGVTSGEYDFVVGATSGSVGPTLFAEGFFGEVRFWTTSLSGSELDDHALNFQSVGVQDPIDQLDTLQLHWPLNESASADGSQEIFPIEDLSRNGRVGTGSLFEANTNPYRKSLLTYNYLSPSKS